MMNDHTTDFHAESEDTASASPPVTDWFNSHPLKLLFGVFLLLMLLPFVILFLIKIFDPLFPEISIARLPDGINTWFSFWGSYLGCVATVILSVGAIILSHKFNQYTASKDRADQISAFNNFEVKDVALYYLPFDYPMAEMQPFFSIDNTAQFLLVLSFERPFPPHYDVTVQWVRLSEPSENPNSGISIPPADVVITSEPSENPNSGISIPPADVVITSDCHRSKLRILAKRDTLKKLYCSHLMEKTIPWRERHQWLSLKLKCENRLQANGSRFCQPLQVTVALWLYNCGTSENGTVQLEVEERKISCEAREGLEDGEKKI